MINNKEEELQMNTKTLPFSFEVKNTTLFFKNIDLITIVDQYDTPLKFTDLQIIENQIKKIQTYFQKLRSKINYSGAYHYAYCTKAAHFNFILKTVINSKAHIEISTSADTYLIQNLWEEGYLKNQSILCNGYKDFTYLNRIIYLSENTNLKIIAIIDNKDEWYFWNKKTNISLELGIRLTLPNKNKPFKFSRLGIPISEIIHLPFSEHLHKKVIMLHFFIGDKMEDEPYYWNCLDAVLTLYNLLYKKYNCLKYLNIGGGLPVVYDTDSVFPFLEKIARVVQKTSQKNKIQEPHIFTEFGKFTVGSSGMTFYKIHTVKKQDNNCYWYLIDDSFISSLPDIWGLKAHFLVLPLNHWNKKWVNVRLGGISCDTNDYYPPDGSYMNLPAVSNKDNPLYIGVFGIGAYQEALAGYGKIRHCLLPAPKYIVRDPQQKIKVFRNKPTTNDMLKSLGY